MLPLDPRRLLASAKQASANRFACKARELIPTLTLRSVAVQLNPISGGLLAFSTGMLRDNGEIRRTPPRNASTYSTTVLGFF
jgi:hypothetical protein